MSLANIGTLMKVIDLQPTVETQMVISGQFTVVYNLKPDAMLICSWKTRNDLKLIKGRKEKKPY